MSTRTLQYAFKENLGIAPKVWIKNQRLEYARLLIQQSGDNILLVKKVYYPQSYVDELKVFGFKQDEIYRYLLCSYQNDIDLHKRPLSKLIKDISEELGLIPQVHN